jgi:hypothetical protein
MLLPLEKHPEALPKKHDFEGAGDSLGPPSQLERFICVASALICADLRSPRHGAIPVESPVKVHHCHGILPTRSLSIRATDIEFSA